MTRRVVLSSLAFAGGLPWLAFGQRFIDERIPTFGEGSTASIAHVHHGDVNGDGRIDLVVRESGNTEVIFPASALGFLSGVIVDASDTNHSLLVDLNGDGRDDLLTQDFVEIGYYPGLSTGTTLIGGFQKIEAKGTGEVYWHKGAADVDGDGKIDVIAGLSTNPTGSAGVLRWYSGNGNGTFTKVQSVPTSPYPIEFALGDFNGDGFIDAAAAGPTAPAAFVFFGAGSAGFLAPQPVSASGAEARHVSAGDLDADGIDDLVTAYLSSQFSWFRGSAAGFVAGGTQVLPGAGAGVNDLYTADLDGNGAKDVLVPEGPASGGHLWSSLSTPGLGPGAPSIVIDRSCSSVTAFDYDGAPGLDLAYLERKARWPTLRPSDGAAGFVPPMDISVGAGCSDADSVAAGDLDGDGVLDLATEVGTWLRGVGDGTFSAPAPLGGSASELVDLNGDGRLDGVALRNQCGALGGLTVALHQGTSFGPDTRPLQPALGAIVDFAVADLDFDGDLDLASAGPGGVFTHLNSGSGAFAPFIATSIPSPANNVAAGDLNGDGLADLACTNYVEDFVFGSVTSDLSWGLSTGTGALTSVKTVGLFVTEARTSLIDDFDDDGFADVLWDAGSQVLGFRGDGTGNLSTTLYPVVHQSGAPAVYAIVLADIDGDGERDVITGALPDGQVGIGRRKTPTAYSPWRQIAAGGGAGKLLPYDFDLDGRTDLAWGWQNQVRVSLTRVDDPPGTSSFGVGTPGCLGAISIGAFEPAKLSSPKFRVLTHHLPPVAPGWLLIGGVASPGGVDPLGIGLLLHVDPSGPTVLVPLSSDAAGQADVPLPVPFQPSLLGASFWLQAVFSGAGEPGGFCSNAGMAWVSSRGLALTIQNF